MTERVIDRLEEAKKLREIGNVRALRSQLASEQGVPERTLDSTLLLATWNIREFGPKAKVKPRLPESFVYMAEMLQRFDLIAIQEVRDIKYLRRVVDHMGPWWKYMITDVTEGRAGNRERLAYVYDSRKVEFDGLVGEIVLPGRGARQFARTPFLCGFKSGMVHFQLCTAHVYFGEGQSDDERVEEVNSLAKLLSKRSDDADTTVVLLGDLNVFKERRGKQDPAMDVLERHGFAMPAGIKHAASNTGKRGHPYDQIAINAKGYFETTGKSGVFDFFESVFRTSQQRDYAQYVSRADYERWRTYQMSDHKVKWVELRINFRDEMLDRYAYYLGEALASRISEDEGDEEHWVDYYQN